LEGQLTPTILGKILEVEGDARPAVLIRDGELPDARFFVGCLVAAFPRHWKDLSDVNHQGTGVLGWELVERILPTCLLPV
jgi:hypothetical protein